MPYGPEHEANYKSDMRTYIYFHLHTTPCLHLDIRPKNLEKRINKTTMIERVKQKWDPHLNAFFWNVSSNKLDIAAEVEECWLFLKNLV